VTGLILGILIVRNLVSPDYPFHLHNIWAVHDGNALVSPFLSGGSHAIYRYGLPVNVMGAALFPVLQEHSVSFLIVLSLPLLWVSSKKVFEHFVDGKIAMMAATLAVMNPLTYGYVLAATLPFLWATVFGFFSLYLFLEGKKWPAVVIGVLAIVTHPLSALLFASILLIKPDYRTWLGTYLIPMGVFLIQMAIFFGLFTNIYTGEMGLSTHFLYRLPLLAGALTVAALVKRDTRMLSGTALAGTGLWAGLGLIGFWIPLHYFERPAFFILLLLTPFMLKMAVDNLHGKKQYLIPIVALGLVFTGAYIQLDLGVSHEPTDLENDETRRTIADIVENEYVYYGSRGPDLYELPRFENVKFSNTGKFPHQEPPENVEEYLEKLEEQNASYVLIHGETPDNAHIEKVDFPLIYEDGKLKLYEVKVEDNY